MNEEAQAELNRILAIDPKNLTHDEVEFLAARRSYVKDSQLDEYAEVLKKRDNAYTKIEHQTSEKETVKTKDASTK